jgi:hypothetical protein
MSDLNVFGFEVDDSVNINGTSLMGTVRTTYDNLVEVLGEPTYTEANPYEKVACEWTITEQYDWHIGGNDYQAVEIAEKIING